ncbi:unnamed protein product [Fusarium graminearum]|nr:unnamed protein product [Fusarium graminearum]
MAKEGIGADGMKICSIWRIDIINEQINRLIKQLADRNADPEAPFDIGEEEPLFFALATSRSLPIPQEMIREMTDDEMYDDGLQRLEQIRVSIREHRLPNHKSYSIPPTVNPYYEIEFDETYGLAVHESVLKPLKLLDLPVDGYYIVYVKPAGTIGILPYYNYVHNHGEVVICVNIRSDETVPKYHQRKWADMLAVVDTVPDVPDASISPFASKKDRRGHAKRIPRGSLFF